jgi:allantoin racemase
MSTKYRIAVIGTGFRPIGGDLPPDEIADIVSNTVDARLVEIPEGVFPADEAARVIVDEQYLQAGLQAARDGYDALYINTVGDYGLNALRAALAIPVVSSGESSVRIAASHGRFSIVTIWPPALDFIYARVLDDSGVIDAYQGTTHLSADGDMASLAVEENFVTDMRSCSLNSMQQILAARDTAIEQAGSAAVVLGCTCMAPAAVMLEPHPFGITIDPLTLGYQLTEYCLRNGVLPEDIDYDAVKTISIDNAEPPWVIEPPIGANA